VTWLVHEQASKNTHKLLAVLLALLLFPFAMCVQVLEASSCRSVAWLVHDKATERVRCWLHCCAFMQCDFTAVPLCNVFLQVLAVSGCRSVAWLVHDTALKFMYAAGNTAVTVPTVCSAGGQRLQECGLGGASQSKMYIQTLLAILLWPFAMLAGDGGQRLQEFGMAGA
jgi:hypothetical protein